MRTRCRRTTQIRPPKDFKVQRLSDEFRQYLFVIKCAGCAHERRAYVAQSLMTVLWFKRIEETGQGSRSVPLVRWFAAYRVRALKAFALPGL